MRPSAMRHRPSVPSHLAPCYGEALGRSSLRAITINSVSTKSGAVQFILATGFVEGSPFPPFYEKAKAKGWKTITVPCGHDVMLDLPEELTRILLDVYKAQASAV
jgi:hypothetical protein